MIDVLKKWRCKLTGHHWKHLPNAVPEDRESYWCSRCDQWGFRPARVGENEVPKE